MKQSVARKALALVIASVFAMGMLVLASCAPSSSSSSAASSSASASASSSSASSGDVMYTVPNVVSLSQSDAEKAIYASGLMVGTITPQASDTVAKGAVISQEPAALTNAKANSKVNLVISSGKAQPKDVNVPDLKGKTQSEAEKLLADSGLIGVPSNPEETTEVSPGLVFKQSVAAGTTVKEGTRVAFTVALSPAQTTVPDVVGKTKDDAKAAITAASLGFDNTSAYSDSVAEGLVISQSVAAGSKVTSGTTVSVVVSLGAKPAEDVKVPDVVTYSWSDAEAALRSAGLAARYTGDPAGTVIAQDVAPGTMVAPNTLVTVTLASPTPVLEAPNLMGLSLTSAEQITDNMNLALSVSGDYDGIVVDQYPAAGTQVYERDVIYVTVQNSAGTWTAAASADEAAKAAGFDSFDVMDSITIGSNTFSNPRFEYHPAGAVRAVYDAPACGVQIAKCKSNFPEKATDLSMQDFSMTWSQNFKGLDITCFGNAEDQATMLSWSFDNATFVAAYIGYGGETMTMDPDDVTSLVAGIQ